MPDQRINGDGLGQLRKIAHLIFLPARTVDGWQALQFILARQAVQTCAKGHTSALHTAS
jgi:hypothetical protein